MVRGTGRIAATSNRTVRPPTDLRFFLHYPLFWLADKREKKMDERVYEVQKINALTQPNDSAMKLRNAVLVLAHQLDEALTRIAALEARPDRVVVVTTPAQAEGLNRILAPEELR
jgi:hypothetical protein